MAGSLSNPQAPGLFLLIGLLGVTIVVPTVVVSANHSLTTGLVTGGVLATVWVVGGLLMRASARRAVERERAWAAALPFDVGPSYWELLEAEPHVFYSTGTEGAVENATICRHLRVHLQVPPELVSALNERLRARVPKSATVAADDGGQVAVTKKVSCSEHARPGRAWLHDLVEGGIVGFDRAAEIRELNVSWTRTSYLVKRDAQAVDELIDEP